jgi:hypothetical protein
MDQTTKARRFLKFGDLMKRWNVSRQCVERWSRVDPAFPPAYRFADSRDRKYEEGDVETYERSALSRKEART